jgi:hypothetical protein
MGEGKEEDRKKGRNKAKKMKRKEERTKVIEANKQRDDKWKSKKCIKTEKTI